MYLWDTNILRAFIHGHPTIQLHFKRIPWSQIALPSVVIAEIIQGRCEAALKATPVLIDRPNEHQPNTSSNLLHNQTATTIVALGPAQQAINNVWDRVLANRTQQILNEIVAAPAGS